MVDRPRQNKHLSPYSAGWKANEWTRESPCFAEMENTIKTKNINIKTKNLYLYQMLK